MFYRIYFANITWHFYYPSHLKDGISWKAYFLDYLKRENEETKKWRLDLENKRRLAKNLKPVKDLSEIESKTDEKTEDQVKEDDPLLLESGYVLIDLTQVRQKSGSKAIKNFNNQ